MVHKPVLIKEVLKYLNPKPNENFIDATIGEGGHAKEILNKNRPLGKLLAIDLDKSQIENSRLNLSAFGERIILINDSYSNIKEIVEKTGFNPVNGILLDLGFSSWHLEKSNKGFSFQKDEPLDMRYSDNNELTAEKIVNEYPEKEIEKILREYGEEKFSKIIAQKIVEYRNIKNIKTTLELKGIIESVISKREKIHPATRTFQALRIAVNRELDNLKEFLPKAVEILADNGRLVVISFHSLEDKIVKKFFNQLTSGHENLSQSDNSRPRTSHETEVTDLDREKLNQIYPVKSLQGEVSSKDEQFNRVKILTKKPVIALSKEIFKNPRARSAKLRGLIKI